jgi:SNF2 family DNA or RNA helicase
MAKALHIADYLIEEYSPLSTVTIESKDLIKPRPKIVVGMHHQDAIALMANELTKASIPYLILDGTINGSAKDAIVQKFKNEPRYEILILSMLAGGVGIDGLQHVCSEMLTVERQWRGAHEEQYEGRLHRDGQMNPVHNDIYIAEGTIDEYMDKRVEETRHTMNEALDKNYEHMGDSVPYNIREAAEWCASHSM